MSVKILNKIFAGIISVSMLTGNVNVIAGGNVIDKLLNCKNGVQLADKISTLTADEVKNLGISTDNYNLYKRLNYPEYVGSELIEQGFSDVIEFRTKFSQIVNDMIYTKQYSVDDYNTIVSFRSEAGITNKGRGTAVLWGETNTAWSGKSLIFVPFEIDNGYAVLDGTIQTRSNGVSTNNNSKIKAYTTEPLPTEAYEKWGFDVSMSDWKKTIHRNFSYKIADDTEPDVTVSDAVYAHMGFSTQDVADCWADVYSMWNNYKNSMSAVNGDIMSYNAITENNVMVYVSNSVNLGDELIAELNKKEGTSLVLGLGADNNNAILMPAKTVLTFTYDKTAEWEHELITEPARDEVEVFGATQMVIKSNDGFYMPEVSNDNFYMCINDEMRTDVGIYAEPTGTDEITVYFNDELMLGTEYIVGIKNLKNSAGDVIHNREIKFTTSKIYKNIDIELENVLTVGEDYPIRISAYLENGKEEVLPWDKLNIVNNKFKFENGAFCAEDYGKDIITVTHTNKADGTVLKKGVLAVAPAKAQIKEKNNTINGAETILETNYTDFVAEGRLFDDMSIESGENCITVLKDREIKVGINTDISEEYYVYNGEATAIKRSMGQHQVAVDVGTDNVDVYIDGILVDSFTYSNAGKSSIGAVGNGNIKFTNFGVYFVRDTKPVVNNIEIKNKNEDNTAYLGESIKAQWEYYDAENDEQCGTVSGWYISDSEEGEYELISSEQEILLANEYFKKWLKFVIIPANEYASGVEYETEPMQVILCEDAETALALINNSDIYGLEEVLDLYADVLGIAETLKNAKNKISDMRFVYAELQYKNFESPEGLQNALSSAVNKYLKEEYVYCSSLIVNQKTTTEGLVKYEFMDAPGYTWNTSIQNLTGNDGYLTFKNITDIDAIADITLQYTGNVDTEYNNSVTEFSGYSVEEIPEGFEYNDWIQYDFDMKTARERKYHHQELIEYNITDYVKELLTEGTSLTIRLRSVGTGTANIYLPNTLQDSQKPKLVITYDVTKRQKNECEVIPGNFETEVSQSIDKYKINWKKDVDMLTWNSGTVKVINCETGTEPTINVREDITAIEILEPLQPLAMYCVMVDGVKDMDGNSINSYNFYFTTDGDFERIQQYTQTALKSGSETAINVKGILNNREYLILPEDLIYNISDEKVAEVSTAGIINAKKRGTAVVTVNYKNIFENKFMLTVYNTADKYTFETDEIKNDNVKYDGKYSMRVDGEFLLSENIKNSVVQLWFYDDLSENTVCGFKADETDIRVSGASYSVNGADTAVARSKGWHQLVIDNTHDKADVYVDTVKVCDDAEIDMVKAYAEQGDMYIDFGVVADVKGSICVAKNVKISGGGYVNEELTGSYIYEDKDGDAENGTVFAWYESNSENGNYSEIVKADEITFTPSSAYENKYIKFAVIPKNINDDGEIVYSSAKKITQKTVSGGGSTGGGGSYPGGTGGVTMPGIGVNTQSINNPGPFNDVPPEHWAYEGVMSLYNDGIVNGRTTTQFEPDGNITRAEFIKLIVVAMGFEETNREAVFSDVLKTDWYYSYIMTAYENKIANGYGTEFRPNANITRQEMAVMIINAYEKFVQTVEIDIEPEMSDKSDISEWAKEAVYKAYQIELLGGMGDNTFAPLQNSTRAQAAVVIKRFIDKIK